MVTVRDDDGADQPDMGEPGFWVRVAIAVERQFQNPGPDAILSFGCGFGFPPHS